MRRAARFDAVQLVESCYGAACDDRAWLRGLLAALDPLAAGRGTYAKAYDLSDPGDVRMEVLAERGPLPEFTAATLEVLGVLGVDGFRAMHDPNPPVQLLSRRLQGFPARARQRVGEIFGRLGLGDVLGILAGDHDGRGVLLAVVVERGYRPPPLLALRLRSVAAHVLAGRRLREKVPPGTSPLTDAGTDAVLDPTGAVADARGAARARMAREVLRAAVRRAERARGPLRRTAPEEALALWRGLVDGTWSLVDHVDTDGRRFVLARRNPPEVTDPRALLPRERAVAAYAAMGHSNKYIGYMLGIAPTTVASHLRSAEHKLGLASRSELILALGATRASRASATPDGC